MRTIARLLLPMLALSGCFTLADSSSERFLDPAEIEALEPGRTTMPDALRALGSPLEVHSHTDGTLFVYAHAERKTFQMVIGPSGALRLIDVTQVVAELLGNLSYTYERVYSDEDRLVLLFDRERVLQAVGVTRAPE